MNYRKALENLTTIHTYKRPMTYSEWLKVQIIAAELDAVEENKSEKLSDRIKKKFRKK